MVLSTDGPSASADFEKQFSRILQTAKTDTMAGLARFLGVRPAKVSDALRRRSVPSAWLAVLARHGAQADWILWGKSTPNAEHSSRASSPEGGTPSREETYPLPPFCVEEPEAKQ